MNYLKVNLWGDEIGRLAFNPKIRQCYFTFNPVLKGQRPDVSPLLLPVSEWASRPTVFGDDRRIYQNLPPFIADSLPDDWGNLLYEQWARNNKLPQSRLNPLYKLMFIGKRGMGALEFEPYAKDLDHTSRVDVNALYSLSIDILNKRENVVITPDNQITMQSLLAVGTSAGGRNMKATIAIDKKTGEIRSGQVEGLDGYDYFILKFQNEYFPSSEIEMVYYEMALAAGIEIEECSLIKADGKNHFLTKRFDRKNGSKIHMQSLAAINPEAKSYEDLFATCRELELSEKELEQVFRRMVFNILANNTDDHNKNFSFLLEKGGKWRLSPAYDITFIFNKFANDAETERCLAVAGKFTDITKEDLIKTGMENNIRNPEGLITQVADSLLLFSKLSEKYGIDPRWGNIIRNTLARNLSNFNYIDNNYDIQDIIDSAGRNFSDIKIKINGKGHYEISTKINGARHRRFVRPNMPLYQSFQNNDFIDGSSDTKVKILQQLFPI